MKRGDDRLPGEIEEQALVDGATRFEVLRYVTFPLAVAGMVVTFVFSFLLAWNDVLFASVLTSPATRTVSVGCSPTWQRTSSRCGTS